MAASETSQTGGNLCTLSRVNQIFPAGSSKIQYTVSGKLGNWTNFPFTKCARPARVPIQRLPSRAPSRETITFDGKRLASGDVQGRNREPSKGMRPHRERTKKKHPW